MKAVLSILCVAGLFVGAVCAEIQPWKLSINSNLMVSLNTYSDNWTGGESGAFSWTAKLDAQAEKQLSDKLNSRNTLKLAFGQTKIQDPDTKKWGAFAKSTDLIDVETFWRITMGKVIDPFASVRLESQFYDISDSTNERYGNPLKFTEALGGASQLRKTERLDWIARLGAASRQTIDRDAVQPDLTHETKVTSDAGLEFLTELKATNTAKWLTYASILKVYEALVSSAAEDVKGTYKEDRWRFPDVDWENNLTMNITKYVMLNFYVKTIYDREIDRDPQLKETLSLGLTYTATNVK